MQRAFYPANIMLPKRTVNMEKWSVVACDQFTSEPEYWEDVEKIVGDSPSSYRMILPEVYLEEKDVNQRLEKIRRSMKEYLSKEIFDVFQDAMIYVERTDSTGKTRKGLIGCIDLEQYDYQKGSVSLVRATEATVMERIPPRMRVRENAEIELPHIMILIDDKADTVICPLEKKKEECTLLYDFDLMKEGGHLAGWLVEKEEQEHILKALDRLAEQEEKNRGKNVMLFAMGDGNHSLACAKDYYEQLKAKHPKEDFSNHPARYALVEIVNLHSPALEFKAIHRIVTQADTEDLLKKMTEKLGLSSKGEGQKFTIVYHGKTEEKVITKPTSKLTVGSLQNFLDDYQKEHPIKMDYIHEEKTLEHLANQKDSIGFLLPVMEKEELFPTVICDGALPRKTFSMGHAQDKRYYTECRKITK